MIALLPHAEGVILSVKAQPGASKAGLRGEHAGMLKVCVTQVAEKGKANKAILEVLCSTLDLRKSQIELIAGETASTKQFLIRGLSEQELQERLARACDRDEV